MRIELSILLLALAACRSSSSEQVPASGSAGQMKQGVVVGSARLYVPEVRFANPEHTVLGLLIGLENTGSGTVVSNENAFTVSACKTDVHGNESFEDFEAVKGFGETLPAEHVEPGKHVEGWVPFRITAGCADLVLKFDGLDNGEGSLRLVAPR